jgi:uncharacterized coiled-coil DUF342 family protein
MKITINHVHYHYHHDPISPELVRLARQVRRLAIHNDNLIPDAGCDRPDGAGTPIHQPEVHSMSETQAAVIAALTDAKASLLKTASEIPALQAEVDTLKAKIVELQTIIDQGGVISEELVNKANEVAALAKSVDELIPDAPVVPVVVPEEAPV